MSWARNLCRLAVHYPTWRRSVGLAVILSVIVYFFPPQLEPSRPKEAVKPVRLQPTGKQIP